MINLESRRVLLIGCWLFVVLVLILGLVLIGLLIRDNERQDTLEAVGTEVKALEQTLWAIQHSVATFDELLADIRIANLHPDHDTIILTADIKLEGELPHISTPITLEGAGHSIDGVDSYQVFYVEAAGDLTINGLTIQNGTAHDGGGIRNDGTLTVTNSTFSGNTAENYGGGIYAPLGRVTVIACTFTGNKAGLGGGGISTNSTLNVTGSTFTRNSSTNSGGQGGGAIHNHKGVVMITASTLSGNSAKNYGGGISNVNGGTLTITNSTLSSNTAENYGGAILNNQGTVTITSSTLSGNSAGSTGGGISNMNGGTLTITNSTFSDNSAPDGGGIRNRVYSSVSLAGNLFQQGDTGSNCSGRVEDLGYNLSSDMSCQFSNTGSENDKTDIHLESLTNNGGPTQTRALRANSAALNKIPKDNELCKSGGTDQRGELRPNPPEEKCDIGAYEAGP